MKTFLIRNNGRPPKDEVKMIVNIRLSGEKLILVHIIKYLGEGRTY